MASKDISAWRTEVAKYAKGVDGTNFQTLLDDEIKEVFRDFCEHTHLWTQTLTPITVVADTRSYTLTVPDTDGKADIEIVESVLYKEDGADDDQYRPLGPIVEWVEDDSSGKGNFGDGTYQVPGMWKFQTSPEPRRFYVDSDKTLNLYPIPTAGSTDGLLVTIITKPADDATKVPEFLFEDWKKTITWGAAGRILGMTTQKWFDAKLGEYYWSKYLNRRMNAALKKETGYTRRDMKVQVPHFAGSRSNTWVF